MIRTRLAVLILVAVALSTSAIAQPRTAVAAARTSTVTVVGTVLRISLAADRLPNGEIGEVSTYLTLHNAPTLPIKCPNFVSTHPQNGPELCRTARANDIVLLEGELVFDSAGLEPLWVIVPLQFDRVRQE